MAELFSEKNRKLSLEKPPLMQDVVLRPLLLTLIKWLPPVSYTDIVALL